MKKLLVVTLIISVVSALFMVIFFLISTDVYHDYVSIKALKAVNIVDNMEKLPVWAIGTSLWKGMQIDFIIRIVFMILITVVMLKLVNNKNLGSITKVMMLALIFLSFVSMFFYFLASHDIYNEYISKNALITGNMNYNLILKYSVNELPLSSECRFEWFILKIDFWLRFFFMTFTIITLIRSIGTSRTQFQPV